MNRWLTMVMMALVASSVCAQSTYPTAIFPFAERGSGVKGYGSKVSDILFAELAADPVLMLVDRESFEAVVTEHELNLSGMVKPTEAVQVGQLVGAKLLITGSVIEVDKELHLVAKVIGTETSRVLGVSVKGKTSDQIGPMVADLSAKIVAKIGESADTLVAERLSRKDRLAQIRNAIGERKRPVILVSIDEQHIGRAAVDPAAATEVALLAKEAGFTVLDAAANPRNADIIVKGVGFSEFGTRRGDLTSVTARVEVKAINPRTSEILAIDRQVAVEVDLTEQIAGKKALQMAAAMIAERMLPKLAGK